ncbi:hypothetical protein JNJ66_00810 [Candidatus Saccharibacteria bacterium]|nr:hypothetical protein [Candidatus Saccharibacteria bacterium]
MTSHTQKPLAAQVYDELKHLLAKETSPYLAADRFVLQKDAFVRLSDDDIESDGPFLSYAYNQMTGDEALDFALYLLRDFFVFEIGPSTYSMTYEIFGHDSMKVEAMTDEELLDVEPSAIAANILLTIKMLLNGQLAVGCTWRDGELLASELFLLGLKSRPVTLAVSNNFSLTRRAGLDYSVKQNHLLDERVKVTQAYPLLPDTIGGTRAFPGREVDSIEGLEPLSRKQLEELEVATGVKQLTGDEKPRNFWKFYYTSIEFWIISIIVISPMLYLRLSPDTPEIFKSVFAHAVMLMIAWSVIPFGTGLAISWRRSLQHKREVAGRRKDQGN